MLRPPLGVLDATARERIMPSSETRKAPGVPRMWLVVQASAFLRGVTSRGGRAGGEQPALPRSAGHRRCPGDMMIDWVSPACGGAAAQSDQAARLALGGKAGSG